MDPDTPLHADSPQRRRQRTARLAELAAGARGRQRAAAFAVALSGVAVIAQAALIAWLVQAVFIARRPLEGLALPFGALAAVLLLRVLLSSGAQHAAGAVADVARRALRAQVYRALMARGPLWLRRQRSGELGELLLAHGEALEGYYAGYLQARVEVTVVPLAILAAVFPVEPVVGVILLCTAPLIPVFMMLVGWGAEAAGRHQLQALARMGGHFADRLKGLGLLRLYGRGEAELAGIAAAAEGVRERTLKVLRIAFLSSTVLEFFASASVAMVALYLGLGYLGMLGGHGAGSLGVGVFCLMLAPEFYGPLRRLAAHYHDRANALAAISEVERLLGPSPLAVPPGQVAEPAREPELAQARGPWLVARHLRLRPQGAQADVVEDLSLEIAAGRRLALMGPSGSGKSTVLEALAGWLPPREGRIVQRPGLRVGYAGQRPYLFHGSIADNLRLAAPGVSEARLRAVAEAAQVMRFAARLPQGLDTVIGERGFGLSGGEARRIALARLLLREPDLLLLDEPTAFLDPGTEADLLDTLGAFARERAVIVATHSAAVCAWADARVVLPARIAPVEVPA
ncbi:thiol reductant ABC exporter subunit CydD [Stenotrophomonas sp. HITSZ_GD]|uniref:thiol reductant ABC exporter subunit CydD n=1 Tax=Stenotrophomonas sp. HITSZ_GD TaxID=3037248 RepID=UPI00240D2FAF|nr:thiol reductant ABC exporter subunit CydD [Stenotrophomonas sp. HITSZ_GD]MDG2526465.1 thiol reductant ABC exporter subunit CydD [Stenotrophomonas sp. HITSZ_GD]